MRLLLGIALFLPIVCQAQLDLKSAKTLKIKGEHEGVIKLELPKEPTRLKPFVVFVRPKTNKDFEIIARGRVETIQNGSILVSLDKASIYKFPNTTDLAVPLGTPRDWPPDADPAVAEAPVQAEAPGLPPDPGFIQLNGGKLYANINSTSSDNWTNEYKDAQKYQPPYTHFLWYFEFFWSLGLEYENFGGAFPTSTYYHETGASSEKTTQFAVNYRWRRTWMNEKLRPTVRLLNLSSQFETLNKDEALISTSMTASGLGMRWSYEPINLVWTPSEPRSALKFRQAYADFSYYPMVTVLDGNFVSRGTSSPGSMIYDLKVAADFIIYLNFMPWFKRYLFEVGYGLRVNQYNFAGPTKSEAVGNYTVPASLSSKENYQWYYVSLGICFEDWIGEIFKPR